MADLFSRGFQCLLVPSCNIPQKPSERLRISAPTLPKQRVRVTNQTHVLVSSTSTPSSSSNSAPEDYDILSSTESSDGSVVFKFATASEIRKRIAEMEQEKLVQESVEEGRKDGIRTLLSDVDEKFSTEVDHNLVEEIESSSTVVVGVADQSLKLPVNEEERVALENDYNTAAINDSQEIDGHLMLDSVEDVKHRILSEDVAAEGNDVLSVSEEDSEVDSHKEVVVSEDSEYVAVEGNGILSASEEDSAGVSVEGKVVVSTNSADVAAEGKYTLVCEEDSEAESHKEVDVSTDSEDVTAEGSDAPSPAEQNSEADSRKEVVSTITPDSNILSDLNSVASGEVEEKEEADKGHGVDTEINKVTGGVDADLSEMPASTSLESEQEVSDDEETTQDIGGVDRTANSLHGGVDTDVIELMPLSTSESNHVTDDGEITDIVAEDSIVESKMEKSAMLHELAPTLDLENIIDVGNNERSDRENPLPVVPEIHSVETASHVHLTLDWEKASRTELLLVSGAACLPHPSKALTGREVAYFISHQSWLGLADGVDQWSLEGSNTGLYVKELMDKCETIVSNHENISIIKPEEVLTRSASETESHGSSAVLVAHFDGQVLHAANVGNTGFIIIRDGSIFRKSTPMFHEFSFPLQIVKGDDPSEIIERYKIDLNDGDVIIAATNGLFDNLYEQEIASIISKSLEASLRPQEIAELLAMRAQEVGRSSTARSPFGDAAQAAGYVGYCGGKLVDVNVIVSLVKAR